jgi:hypothetical protein
MRDIRKVMEAARSSHPEHALEQQREEAKESMRTTRSNRDGVGPVVTQRVKQALGLIRAMTPDELTQFDEDPDAAERERERDEAKERMAEVRQRRREAQDSPVLPKRVQIALGLIEKMTADELAAGS